jgi:hypothetical protein
MERSVAIPFMDIPFPCTDSFGFLASIFTVNDRGSDLLATLFANAIVSLTEKSVTFDFPLTFTPPIDTPDTDPMRNCTSFIDDIFWNNAQP